MHLRWSLLIALAAALALAGCLGATGDDGDATPPAHEATPAEDLDASPSSQNLTPLEFSLEEPYHEVLWANGSYQPHESCNTGGCVTGDAYRQIPLDGLPDQAPVRIDATLTYDTGTGSLFAGPMTVTLGAEDATVYAYQESDDTGKHTLQATLLTGTSSPVLEIASWWPSGNPDGTYSLKATLTAGPATVPAGVPVALELEPGDTLHAAPVEGSATIDLHDAEDTLLDRISLDDDAPPLEIPQHAEPGEHVLRPHGGSIEIRANATDSDLRPLPITQTLGDAHEAQADQPLEFTFDAPKNLINVGVYATDQGDQGASASQGTVSMAGPNGSIVEQEGFGCTICITNGYEAILTGSSSDPSIVPGTYEVAYEPGAEEGYAIGGLVVTYER